MATDTTTPYRISGVAGLLFVTLSFVASGVNIQPPTHVQGGAALASWFAEHGAQFRLGYLIAAVAFLPCYFPFFAGLCERLGRRKERRPSGRGSPGRAPSCRPPPG